MEPAAVANEEALGGSTPEEELRASDAQPLLRVDHLAKEYSTGRGKLVLFEDITFQVAAGELVALVGESGAGKSTLLHMMGALDRPSSGDVYCASTPLSFLSTKQAAEFRNRKIGYVWQFHYLLPEFTAAENVALPLLARGKSKRKALEGGSALAFRGGHGGKVGSPCRRAFRW